MASLLSDWIYTLEFLHSTSHLAWQSTVPQIHSFAWNTASVKVSVELCLNKTFQFFFVNAPSYSVEMVWRMWCAIVLSLLKCVERHRERLVPGSTGHAIPQSLWQAVLSSGAPTCMQNTHTPLYWHKVGSVMMISSILKALVELAEAKCNNVKINCKKSNVI